METARRLTTKDDQIGNQFITVSPALLSSIAFAVKAVRAGMNLIISGESGTGRLLLARHVSDECEKKYHFCDLNNMISSLAVKDLQGAVKGAFTGADQEMPGWFQRADGGTLIFHGIAEAEQAVRNKLLAPLARKEIQPIGSQKPEKINASIISILASDARGIIGEELFQLLNGAFVVVPPLRERKEDIILLADAFLRESMMRFSKGGISISENGLDFLLRYSWPGNVRELKNTIAQAVLYCGGKTLGYGLLRSIVEQRLFAEKAIADIRPGEQLSGAFKGYIRPASEQTPSADLCGKSNEVSQNESGKPESEGDAEIKDEGQPPVGAVEITPFSIPNEDNPFFNRAILEDGELLGKILKNYGESFPLLRFLENCFIRAAIEITSYLSSLRKRDKRTVCERLGLQMANIVSFRTSIKKRGVEIKTRSVDDAWKAMLVSGGLRFDLMDEINRRFKNVVISYVTENMKMELGQARKYLGVSPSYLYNRQKTEKNRANE